MVNVTSQNYIDVGVVGHMGHAAAAHSIQFALISHACECASLHLLGVAANDVMSSVRLTYGLTGRPTFTGIGN